ncbi:MAG: hypothetical protein LQ350_000390 [Teloschistes chrysophthalmus]|nr:MAG: hypothetical protein LQ350_000390 [Niorma chrysophthalma]
MAVLGSAVGSSNVGSSIFDGNYQNSSPPGLVDLSSPPPVGFTGPVRIKADSSPIDGSSPPKLVVERSSHHQLGAHGKSSSRSGTGGSKAPKRKPKYKGSSGSYATHGNSHSDQTSAAVPSMKNPFSYLVRRSEASNPVVIPGSIVEVYNDHGDTKSVVLPDIFINATDDVSTARQNGFLAGYKDGWAVGEAIQEEQQQVMGPCMGSYSLFGASADPCHSRWIDLFVAVPMIVGALVLLATCTAGIGTCCGGGSDLESEKQQKSEDQPDKDVEMAMILHAEEWETADEGSDPEDWKSAAEDSEAHDKMTSYW